MEWGNIILVAVSGLVGVSGTLLGAILNNHFGRQQMKEAWAEEERRRKSDRRRELYERELRIVSDSVDAIVGAMAEVGMLDTEAMVGKKGRDAYAKLLGEVGLMFSKGTVLTHSLGDEELIERYDELVGSYIDWSVWLSRDTGEPIHGREAEYYDLREQTEQVASEVWRRIREILEEV